MIMKLIIPLIFLIDIFFPKILVGVLSINQIEIFHRFSYGFFKKQNMKPMIYKFIKLLIGEKIFKILLSLYKKTNQK